MTLLPSSDGYEGPPQFDIVVRDEKETTTTFRTKRIISNIGADALRGRGTRVWEVIELDSRGKEKDVATCVLKDVWADDDRAREGKIMEDIKAAAQKQGPELLELVDACFLTTITYGDVHVNGRKDKTRQWDLPANVELLEVKNDPREFGRIASNLAPVGTIALEPGPGKAAIQYFATKTHHRIVFKEKGVTIRDVPSLHTVFRCLEQAVIGKRHAAFVRVVG